MTVPFPAQVPEETAPGETPTYRPPLTQSEADAIANNLDTEDVDHIVVCWLDGFKGLQPVLWAVKTRWLGYMMALAFTVVALSQVAGDDLPSDDIVATLLLGS